MSNTSSGRATLILGITCFTGTLSILVAGLGVIPASPVPLDQIVMGFGATLMAASLGLAVSNVTHGSKRDIFMALLLFLVVLGILIKLQGWKTEFITFGGVVLGVILAEWLLSGALRKWAPLVVEGERAVECQRTPEIQT